MANTLTGLVETIYNAMDVVSREQVGFIPAVSRDSQAEQGALNQTVRSPVVPAMTASDITPSNVSSTGSDRPLEFVDMSLTNARKVSFHLTGEGERSLGSNNPTIARDTFAQAFRTITNEVEADLGALYVGASRAYGTAGTAPFGTANDFTDFAQSHVILDDNGAPQTDRQMVLGSAAMANVRGKQSSLFKANEAGTDELLRRGIVGSIEGFDMHNSQQVQAHTKGTGTAYVTSGSTAVGVEDIALVTGSGTVLAGDVATFAADAVNKYMVTTGVAAPGTISLAETGARVVIPPANAMTIGGSYTANMFFSRSAIQLATRMPAVPDGGDTADDRITIVDPLSGLAFEVAIYRQYRQVSYEVGLVWGVKMVAPRHCGILLG